MDYDSAANYAIMNQLCKVCGEPAAGFHFGAFTCEGCKSFFGRTYNNLSSISECKNNGKCVINKKNRTACKACRLRKCMMVGMSKSGSRYGRRSNWFKIHCLLQQQQQSAQVNNNNNTIIAQPMTQINHIHQQMSQLNHQQQVEMNLAAAASLFRPNPYLNPLFRSHHGANASLVGVPRDTSESDSGASSADPDEEIRSASALSYLRAPTSPLSDKISSDTESLSRRKSHHPVHRNHLTMTQSDPEVYNNSHGISKSGVSITKVNDSENKMAQNHNISEFSKHQSHKNILERSNSDIETYSKRKSLSITPLPSISPTAFPSALVVPNRHWFPPPFSMSDPIAWREFWLRNQPTVAEPAPDQNEPIDLSVKESSKNKESEENSDSESEKNDEGGGDIDVEGEEETVEKVAPLDLTLDR